MYSVCKEMHYHLEKSYKLNHTSNAKSNRSFNSSNIVSSIVTQFYQKIKHFFM